MNDTAGPSATVSSPDLLRAARAARRLGRLLEWTLVVIVTGSLAATALNPARSLGLFVPASLCAGGLLAWRALVISGLRGRLGDRWAALHLSERWLVVLPKADDPALGWSIDLALPALPRGPLFRPALALVGLALLQLVTLPAMGVPPATPAPAATARVIALVLAGLVLHQAAAAAFAVRRARGSRPQGLVVAGALFGLVVSSILASGVRPGASPEGPRAATAWVEDLGRLNGLRWATGYGCGACAEAGTGPAGLALCGPLLARLLLEVGVPGLLVGLWAAAAALAAARRDPWRLAALAGLLLQALVMTELPTLAIAAPFLVLATSSAQGDPGSRGVLRWSPAAKTASLA